MAKPLTVEFGPITPDNIEQVRAMRAMMEQSRKVFFFNSMIFIVPIVEEDPCCHISWHVPRGFLPRSREDEQCEFKQICLLSGCARWCNLRENRGEWSDESATLHYDTSCVGGVSREERRDAAFAICAEVLQEHV
jgi:hypothetical protein